MQRDSSLEETLMLGGIEGRRRRGQQRRRWLGGITDSVVWANSGRQRRTGKPGVLQPMGWQRVGHDWETEQQQRLSPVMHVLIREGIRMHRDIRHEPAEWRPAGRGEKAAIHKLRTAVSPSTTLQMSWPWGLDSRTARPPIPICNPAFCSTWLWRPW